MSSFLRRFLFDPGNAVLLNIESVNVLDLAPPNSINGIGTGAVLMVGEMENGVFQTCQEVTSVTDLTNSFGTLGYPYGTVPANNPSARQRFADGTLTPEFWNGNGIVQLNGKQFGRLIINRVDTSVGSISLTPLPYITGAAAFRYTLSAGQILSLDVGAGFVSATFSAAAATVSSAAQTFPDGFVGGETVTLGADGMPNFVVTFLAGDTTQATVIARINQYAGFAFAAVVDATHMSLTGLLKGLAGQVRVVAASAGGVLTNLGLTVANTAGTGNVQNIAAVTPAEVISVVQAAVTNTRVEVDQNGALRISDTLTTAPAYVTVGPATTATALGFTVGQTAGTMGVAVAVGVGGVFPIVTTGTVSMSFDGGLPFNVTTTNGDSLNATVANINTAAGKTIAFAVGGQLRIIGLAPGGNVNFISGTPAAALTQWGFSAGVVAGVPIPGGVIPAGTVVQDSTAAHVFVTMQDVVLSPSGITVAGSTRNPTLQPNFGPWVVKLRHATDDGTGLAANAGTVTSMPTPPLLVSVNTINPQSTTAALTDAQIDAQYIAAMANTLNLNDVSKQVNIIYSARQSNAVRRQLRANVLLASSSGLFGRIAPVRPPLGTNKATALSVNAEPGVGAYRDQRVIYCYPGAASLVPLIAARGVAGGTGFTASGVVDMGADGFLASFMSQLPPEENPGQLTPFGAGIVGLESSANAQGFVMADYINFKAAGICALRFDDGNAIFQSGVTSVDPAVNSGLVRISRRRMADFIQDSLSLLAKPYGKRLNTVARRKALVSEIRAFMEQLLARGNAVSQRIAGYTIDDVTGNTPQTLAAGLFRIILNVATLSSLDSIVLQTTIGEQVQVTEVPKTS